MTSADILPILTEWLSIMQQSDHELEAVLGPLRLIPESPLYKIPWNLMDSYTKAVAAQVGDQEEWLAWFYAENNMGMAKREVMVHGKDLSLRMAGAFRWEEIDAVIVALTAARAV